MLLTGHADLKMAIEAINKAVLYKFIIKPWDNNDLKVTVERALQHRNVIVENEHLVGPIRQLKLKQD